MSVRLNLEYIKTFLAVVRCKGIGKAAKQLNLTQPAVTTRIKNLENSLNTVLFERVNSGLKLTKRGSLLITYAEQFLQLAELVERDIVNPKRVQGRIRLGVSETISQSWLPNFIERLNQEYPSIEVEINVDISSALRNGLLEREIDLAILLGPISEFSVDNIVLPKFNLQWYTSIKHDVSGSNMFNYPVATYSRNTKPYREIKALLYEKAGPTVRIFSSSSLSACFGLVETGLCVAALPRVLGKQYVERGTIKEFDPGWSPEPLCFTASYLAEPKNNLIASAARIAKEVSEKADTLKTFMYF